jgi:hypothetical protein
VALEKRWEQVSANFTADGTSDGIVPVADASGFFAKQKVTVKSDTQQPIFLEVKRVYPTKVVVGLDDKGIDHKQNMSAYLVVDNANIFAAEQTKTKLQPDEIFNAVYERDPAVALRGLLVDSFGNVYKVTNPFPVSVGDGEDQLEVNDDGSINVNIVNSPVSNENIVTEFNEAPSVASGSETSVVSYVVPAGKVAMLQRITYSGENVATYNLYVNSILKERMRTHFGGDLSGEMVFEGASEEGPKYSTGDLIELKVLHTRPSVGSFNGRIQIMEIG